MRTTSKGIGTGEEYGMASQAGTAACSDTTIDYGYHWYV